MTERAVKDGGQVGADGPEATSFARLVHGALAGSASAALLLQHRDRRLLRMAGLVRGLISVALGSPRSRVRLLLAADISVSVHCAAFLEHSRRLGSRMQVRQPSPDPSECAAEADHSMLLTDTTVLIRWPGSRWQPATTAQEERRLSLVFERLWNQATVSLEQRELRI
jgi:hypothetical protein